MSNRTVAFCSAVPNMSLFTWDKRVKEAARKESCKMQVIPSI